METCYKVFAADIVKRLQLKEERFGFEPEVVAQVAQMRLRIYEIGISYYGRTYAEGKKIGIKDGFRAVYCILKYNLHKAPGIVQFMFYLLIGGTCALLNLLIFLILLRLQISMEVSAATAFGIAAAANYFLSIAFLFRHKARWNSVSEALIFIAVIAGIGLIDVLTTRALVLISLGPAIAKACSSAVGLGLNFVGRRWIVFREPGNPDWGPQEILQEGAANVPLHEYPGKTAI
jgi:dolichol-phosphate mannosyltransferase